MTDTSSEGVDQGNPGSGGPAAAGMGAGSAGAAGTGGGGLADGAAPIRALDPQGPAVGREQPAAMLKQQQGKAAERARAYPVGLIDQLRVRRIAAEGVDEARLRFTRAEDGLGLERILGTSDLVPINFLEQGLRAARPVCRVQIRRSNGVFVGHGTGFLVAPRLLLTNNHVLPSQAMAVRSIAEFDYEDDIDFNPRPTRQFRLAPEELFFTSETLDFSFVAVTPAASDGTALASYGYLRLADDPGKLSMGEYVSIIQHPNGNTKQAALRENQVVWCDANFLHYETDTEPGSSGSPVFNDQWYVVALHHSGVPRSDGAGNWLRRDGTIARPGDNDDDIDWIANEGVRISRIFRALGESADLAAAAALTRLQATGGGAGSTPVVLGTGAAAPAAGGGISTAAAGGALPAAADALPASSVFPPPAEARIVTPPPTDAALYVDRAGYREDFLGAAPGLRVPLPRVGETEQLLAYANFSITFNLTRRLARLTAVNVDGETWQSIRRRRPDTWSYDPRLEPASQVGRSLYDGTRFDYGHLVRRQDACSGADAVLGEADTFHLTNASPQDHDLNTGPWNDLENHVLDSIRLSRSRVSVFTGPVFRDDDPVVRGVRIPQDFFKIVAYADDAGALAAAGWVQRQPAGPSPTEAAPQFLGRFPMWQVPIARIAQISGLDFGPLLAADALASRQGLEAARGFEAIPIGSPDDLIL